MGNYRLYGRRPPEVAVIHGGPGAPGSVAAVARELSLDTGVVEPLQTKRSVHGQVEELRDTLIQTAAVPVILVGHSWGAWLAYMVASRYPSCARKLVLVASGPFEDHYARRVMTSRLGRLDDGERDEFRRLLSMVGDPEAPGRDSLLARLGELTLKTDSFDPVAIATEGADRIAVDGLTFQAVWREASDMRKTGALLAMAGGIRCPVIAIHGDHDPHPAAGVKTPLECRLTRFTFHALDRCGHYPWKERQAAGRFYDILRREIAR